MEKQFREVEVSFDRLKNKFRRGDISRSEYIDRLKELRLKDDEGRFWMIGAQSGKWYYYDGNEWIRSEPPSFQEGKAICIYCGFENKLTAEFCARCGGFVKGEMESICPKCGNKLEDPSQNCPYCSQELGGREEKDNLGEKRKVNFVFRSVSPFSLFIFCGFIGLIMGVVFGAFTGASEYFSSFIQFMPSFLRALQGELFGGILFAGIGGVVGFVVFGAFGFLEAVSINVISSLVGGVKLKFSKE